MPPRENCTPWIYSRSRNLTVSTKLPHLATATTPKVSFPFFSTGLFLVVFLWKRKMASCLRIFVGRVLSGFCLKLHTFFKILLGGVSFLNVLKD